ncbi:MAG: ABC transporter permease, partial [Bacteroidetes bacterium]|nr:ABC transporter permease [Bacteroidota bacterium]
MIKNYFRIAWRQLRNNKLFGWVNISGLAIGLAVFLLLLLHVQRETSFDVWNSRSPQIYRLLLDADRDGNKEIWAGSPNIAGPAFKSGIGDIVQQARWLKHEFGQPANVRYGSKVFSEQAVCWADSSITSIFDIPFLKGNPSTALTRPNTIVISESSAKKYFGSIDPIGKTLSIDNKTDCEITGVYRDFPGNSTLDADFIGSFYTGWMNKSLVWSNASFETWMLLRPGADPHKVETTMSAIVKKEVPDGKQWFSFHLQPLSQVHLYSSDVQNSYTSRTGDLRQVKIVSILALVILLIACINYMNLATAKSQNRFREVGISKTLGATGGMLVSRFYAETALFVLISVGAGVLLLLPAVPFFNHLTGEALSLHALFSPSILLTLLAVALIITLVACSYPPLYLSSFNPKNLFHQTFRRNSISGRLRQSLVVMQFAASVVIIVCTFLFYSQLQYIQNKSLG